MITPHPHPTRRALLIGMAAYESESFPDLEASANDVDQLAPLLRTNLDGSSNFDVAVHVSRRESPINVEDLMRIVDSWFDEAPISDGLIYFSGHASNNNYGLHLAAADTDGHFAAGFPFDLLLHRANQVSFASLTMVLDCCRAGGAGDVSIDTRFDALLLRKNVAILAASRENEDAWAAEDYSIFTEQVIGVLDDGGVEDCGGRVTVFDVFERTRFILANSNESIPVLKAHIASDVVLRT